MTTIDFSVLCEQAKAYSGFEPEDAAILEQEAERLAPYLNTITDAFYTEL